MADKEFSAGGIVIKELGTEIKVLLIKDSYGHWTWPKGHIERGESEERAAAREIEEETGLSAIEKIKHLGVSKYRYRLKGRLIFKTVSIFLFKLTEPQEIKVQTEEIEEAGWFSLEEANGLLDYKGAKETLKKSIAAFKKV